ncbi:hypothetical protein HZA55_07895 [Candidatus Poribacteria bacterium]|nr:hypothetical protein [Candidatus Poribacteria bacterium]
MNITLATWNLDNFQHPSESQIKNRKKIYPKKLDYIENIIVNKLKLPDILAVQEIMGPTEISNSIETGLGAQRDMPKSLQDIEKRLKQYVPYNFYFSSYRNRGIRVALFTKFQVHQPQDIEIFDQLGPESHISFPWAETDQSDPLRIRVFEFGDSQAWYENRGKFTRPPMCVRVSIDNKNLQIFIAHLKSKKPRYDFEQPYPNIKGTNRARHKEPLDIVEEARGEMRSLVIRAREACQLRDIIYKRLCDYPEDSAVLLGDLSDGANSISTRMLEGSVFSSSQKNTKKQNEERQILFNLAALIKSEKKFSYIYENFHEQNDHILVGKDIISKMQSSNSKGLFDNDIISVLNEDIYKKSLAPEGYEHVPNHAPVICKIDI